MSATMELAANQARAKEEAERLKWVRRVRPMALGSYLLRFVSNGERRTVIDAGDGVVMYSDPVSLIGHQTLLKGQYEPGTFRAFRQYCREGDVVLDVGANEGLFTSFAGRLVGESGTVIAIEPQSRMADLVRVNTALNGLNNVQVFNAAMGQADGEEMEINLYPALQNGAASFVRKGFFLRRRERCQFVSPETVAESCNTSRFDVVKIDTEGFEAEVVNSLTSFLAEGRIRTILLDYHLSVLQQRQIDPADIHSTLLQHGMQPEKEDLKLDGYVAYHRAGSDS